MLDDAQHSVLAQVPNLMLYSAVAKTDDNFPVFFDCEFAIANEVVLPIHWKHEFGFLSHGAQQRGGAKVMYSIGHVFSWGKEEVLEQGKLDSFDGAQYIFRDGEHVRCLTVEGLRGVDNNHACVLLVGEQMTPEFSTTPA